VERRREYQWQSATHDKQSAPVQRRGQQPIEQCHAAAADGQAAEHHRCGECAPFRRAAFRGNGHHVGQRAAKAQAGDEAYDQKRLVSLGDHDHECEQAKHENGTHEHGLAADAVSEPAAEDGAQHHSHVVD
jgi:hypothetical protein